MADADPPCQDQACTLQTCLNKHTYNPDACSSQLKQLYLCCSAMYDGQPQFSGAKESTACPMESVTRRWVKQNVEQGQGGKKK